jgi:hypothetical protein
MTDDHRVKSRSDKEVRHFDQGARAYFGVADCRRVDVTVGKLSSIVSKMGIPAIKCGICGNPSICRPRR